MAQATTTVVLDPAAQELVRMTAQPPFLHQLPLDQGRARLDELQSGPVARPDADTEDVMVPGGPSGQVRIRIVRPRTQREMVGGGGLRDRMRAAAEGVINPKAARTVLPPVLYLHGAGWVFGGVATHDRLVRQIAVEANVAVIFPEYSHSPEARFPVAIEECYAVAQWIIQEGADYGLDPARMAIAGDSAGGNMATVVARLARQRGGPRFRQQVLFYPTTDATFDTDSYREFGSGYWLSRDQMMWFWDQYLPDRRRRADPLASPLRASLDDLRGLPPALIIGGEADVLRDEGEAYAVRLREAGVPVTHTRYQGMIHDFVMLNALAEASATRSAIAQAATTLHSALHQEA